MTTDPMTEAVEAAARAMSSTVPNTDGVLWEFVHETGEPQPVTLTDAAQAALEAALPILRAQFAEEVATAWDGDRDLYHLIEARMLASGGRDADAVQDIGTEWLRNYTGGTK